MDTKWAIPYFSVDVNNSIMVFAYTLEVSSRETMKYLFSTSKLAIMKLL